jgi:hypothetical protein
MDDLASQPKSGYVLAVATISHLFIRLSTFANRTLNFLCHSLMVYPSLYYHRMRVIWMLNRITDIDVHE